MELVLRVEMDIIEIREVSYTEAVNELLSEGWKLVKIVGFSTPSYIIAKVKS